MRALRLDLSGRDGRSGGEVATEIGMAEAIKIPRSRGKHGRIAEKIKILQQRQPTEVIGPT